MRKSAFLALILGAPLVTACGDDEAKGGDTEAATDETGTAPTTMTTSTTGAETDDADETNGEDTAAEPKCTPEDECRDDGDCLPGQTCLVETSCTCFGQPHSETDDDDDTDTNGGPSCAGKCGQFMDGAACQCDALCSDPMYNDCCEDLCEVCPQVCDPGEGTCAGKCGVFDQNAPCQCDAECSDPMYDDCCEDRCDECAEDFPLECDFSFPAYGDCANDGPASCHTLETCFITSDDDTDWGVCAQPGCRDASDCQDAPATGNAPVACGELVEGDGDVCYLDCSNEEDCPDDMSCTPQGACAFEGPGFLLYEGFDAGEMPAEWIVVDVDGQMPDDEVSFVTAAWVVSDEFVDDYAAVSTSYYDPVGQADDWLITPPIFVGESSVLSWRAFTPLPAFPDGYEVRISTDGTDIADFMVDAPVFEIAEEETSYTYRSVDLAAAGFESEQIWIAFRNNSDDKFLLFVDDIAVTQ